MRVWNKDKAMEKKGGGSGYIRKESDNNPGDTVSVYQLQSARPVSFPEFSGKLTSAHIWAAQVMVDHFSGLTYVHLI